ncbi:MAG: MFS transporter [Gammaproteobacteria bacterium]|nr:MAG: MFS transporter [Gammaproteobacteria bacterium]
MASHGERSTSGNVRSPLPADDDAGYPRRSYAWAVVAILIGTAILSYTDRQVLSLLVDPIRRDLLISDTEVSLLLGTAFAVVYGVAGIPFGLLADRTSRRNLIFFGVVVWSIGTVACGFAGSFGGLFAARIVVGLGESVLSPSAISLISDYFPPSRRGLAVGSYLSGIAIGNGASILIGGGALHLVAAGVFAGTPIALIAPWRLVLLVIGSPGLLWSLAILAIREPERRAAIAPDASGGGGASGRHAVWRVAPIYLVVATASLVDNAVGAWAPTLLIRDFGRDAAQVGLQLGLLLTIGFGGGVLLGGWLSDRLGRGGRWWRKLSVCLVSSLLILPVCWAIDAAQVRVVMAAVPLYFALSGIVTACGFSSILDVVPNRHRGFAMAVSFFLNVALGAGLGPTSVALVSDRGFGSAAGLGPAIALTAGAGFFLIATVLVLTLATLKPRAAVASP